MSIPFMVCMLSAGSGPPRPTAYTTSPVLPISGVALGNPTYAYDTTNSSVDTSTYATFTVSNKLPISTASSNDVTLTFSNFGTGSKTGVLHVRVSGNVDDNGLGNTSSITISSNYSVYFSTYNLNSNGNGTQTNFDIDLTSTSTNFDLSTLTVSIECTGGSSGGTTPSTWSSQCLIYDIVIL